MARPIDGSGAYWQKQLQDLADRKEHMQRSAMCHSTPAARAERAIRMLSQRIADAQGEKRADICVYGWIVLSDLSDASILTPAILAIDFARRDEVLGACSLSGAALAVFEACEAEGLECFIMRETLPTKGPQYNLHARPKRSAQ